MSSAAHWDHYWGLGHTQSCFTGGKPMDGRPIWSAFFAALPPGARVLDLACGAGAVGQLALESGRNLKIVGVDFATKINPVEGIEFVTGVSIEALPFADAAFDAVVSQFGFEYAAAEAATREAARVLAPGGAMRLLVHAQEGAPIQDLAGRLARSRALLEPEGFVHRLRRFAEAGGPNDGMAEVEAALEAARAGGADNTTRTVLSVLSDAYTLRRTFGLPYVLEKTNALLDELTQYCDRVGDMQAAALSQADAQARCEAFANLGLKMAAVEPVSNADGALNGWLLQGRRPV